MTTDQVQVPARTAIRWPNGDPADITDEQRAAIHLAAFRHELAYPVVVWPLFGGGRAVTLAAAGMVLGVEPDGYTHS